MPPLPTHPHIVVSMMHSQLLLIYSTKLCITAGPVVLKLQVHISIYITYLLLKTSLRIYFFIINIALFIKCVYPSKFQEQALINSWLLRCRMYIASIYIYTNQYIHYYKKFQEQA